jgi:hypothetical protein
VYSCDIHGQSFFVCLLTCFWLYWLTLFIDFVSFSSSRVWPCGLILRRSSCLWPKVASSGLFKQRHHLSMTTEHLQGSLVWDVSFPYVLRFSWEGAAATIPGFGLASDGLTASRKFSMGVLRDNGAIWLEWGGARNSQGHPLAWELNISFLVGKTLEVVWWIVMRLQGFLWLLFPRSFGEQKSKWWLKVSFERNHFFLLTEHQCDLLVALYFMEPTRFQSLPGTFGRSWLASRSLQYFFSYTFELEWLL